MKIKGTLDRVNGTLPVKIRDAFIVEMRIVSRHDIQQDLKACTVPKFDPRTRAYVDDVDNDKLFSRLTKRYIADWRGLTESVLVSLTRLREDEEIDIPEPVDGAIPCDHDRVVFTDEKRTYTLPEFVWSRSWAADFADLIEYTNQHYEEAQAALSAEKKSSSLP